MKNKFIIALLFIFMSTNLWSITLSNTKNTILLSSLAYKSGSLPRISSIDGEMAHGSKLEIHGFNFSNKSEAAPLFFWEADGGETPSNMGRKKTWDGNFNGSFVSEGEVSAIIAPGSKKAVQLDHSVFSSAILGRVDFSSDQIYLWRKKYDDFALASAEGIRARFKNLVALKTGALLKAGQWVVGDVSGATGVIQKVNNSAVFFEPIGGTINADSPINFIGLEGSAEQMKVYASDDLNFNYPLLSMSNSEWVGLYRTFNHKILRVWREIGSEQKNNMYFKVGKGATYAEHTGVASYWPRQWEMQLEQIPKEWTIEEFVFQISSIDTQNGVSQYIQNGVAGWKNRRFRHRTSKYPYKYQQVFQVQVSNGAQPGSKTFFDALYVDDSWHRVIVCSAPYWDACRDPEIQMPLEWSNLSVTISLRLKHLDNPLASYIYVVNSEGLVNMEGFPVR